MIPRNLMRNALRKTAQVSATKLKHYTPAFKLQRTASSRLAQLPAIRTFSNCTKQVTHPSPELESNLVVLLEEWHLVALNGISLNHYFIFSNIAHVPEKSLTLAQKKLWISLELKMLPKITDIKYKEKLLLSNASKLEDEEAMIKEAIKEEIQRRNIPFKCDSKEALDFLVENIKVMIFEKVSKNELFSSNLSANEMQKLIAMITFKMADTLLYNRIQISKSDLGNKSDGGQGNEVGCGEEFSNTQYLDWSKLFYHLNMTSIMCLGCIFSNSKNAKLAKMWEFGSPAHFDGVKMLTIELIEIIGKQLVAVNEKNLNKASSAKL